VGVARARDEGHRFDGEAEKLDVSEELAPGRPQGVIENAPRPADNASQAARAARVRAARRARTP
jgi:hypothetical protein